MAVVAVGAGVELAHEVQGVQMVSHGKGMLRVTLVESLPDVEGVKLVKGGCAM